jgi:uncharacterized protein (TIGR02594 family)
MDNKISQLQTQLKSHGHDPGIIDGIWGPRTRAAMQAYEVERGLPLTQTPTDQLMVQLLGEADHSAPILWLQEATRLMGVRERSGAASNPVILDWARDLDISYSGDDVAWCGLFVAHCLRTALPDEPLPSNPLGARNYERFGVSCEPQVGAVATFWRNSRTSGLGHVGFMVGTRSDAHLIRGGNQSDQVRDAWVPKSRFVGARWPSTGGTPRGEQLPTGGAGTESARES